LALSERRGAVGEPISLGDIGFSYIAGIKFFYWTRAVHLCTIFIAQEDDNDEEAGYWARDDSPYLLQFRRGATVGKGDAPDRLYSFFG